ncbi:Npun_F0494 family protein [Synechococcus sp. WH 8109]|uniref:Npun_F0494 family protein n=1 Tax=Synechococcus sp. WH 8109 TaxID=166314 RepID=UPI0001B8DD83|nr:Npun_F0494 family protein [Synechococcus sp. WH 8109]
MSTGTRRRTTLRRLPGTEGFAIANPTDLLDRRSRDRACRAMGCLPFSEALYRDLQQQGLDAGDLWSEPSRYGRSKRWFRNSEALEDDLRWLISVGVLRREVDGQGLTSRFRLTTLGRQLLDDDPALLQRSISVLDRLRHNLRRHWPL